MARRTSMAVDSDIPFSQMDQRIDRCLGHFRKEFAGEISARALGPRGGEYGSFLPVYLRAPLYLSHHTVVSAKRSREKFEAPTLDSADRTSSISSSLTIEEFNENGQKKRKTNNDYIHAANVLKEATNLRHAADHLKNGGESVEIIALYLHAAIKFLNGAFLLDNMEGPIQIYIDSAKLSMYCATTFERIGEMAAAALAHKCVEVAYMRVLFSMSSRIRKDEHDIQPSVQHSPLGNLNRQELASTSDSMMENSKRKCEPIEEKEYGCKAIGNHPSLHGLLECSEYICTAMDATKKSWRDLSAAENSSISKDAIALVRRALEFHFTDLEGFLYLVRQALEKLDI